MFRCPKSGILMPLKSVTWLTGGVFICVKRDNDDNDNDDDLLCLTQGIPGMPGIPGLPGAKGHRVSS